MQHFCLDGATPSTALAWKECKTQDSVFLNSRLERDKAEEPSVYAASLQSFKLSQQVHRLERERERDRERRERGGEREGERGRERETVVRKVMLPNKSWRIVSTILPAETVVSSRMRSDGVTPRWSATLHQKSTCLMQLT